MKRIFNGSGGRKAALILSLCLIFALAAGTTFALLKAHTDPVQNTFTAATSSIEIDENTDNGEKSSIQVKNTGTATSYVRAKLVMNWVDDSGNVSATPVDITPEITNNWFLGSDGNYYYRTPVAPKGLTDNLLQEQAPITEPTEGKPDGCHLEVTVLAESIQAAPSQAVESAWPAVKVDSDSNLIPAATTTTP